VAGKKEARVTSPDSRVQGYAADPCELYILEATLAGASGKLPAKAGTLTRKKYIFPAEPQSSQRTTISKTLKIILCFPFLSPRPCVSAGYIFFVSSFPTPCSSFAKASGKTSG
jgi:hypothetical protein